MEIGETGIPEEGVHLGQALLENGIIHHGWFCVGSVLCGLEHGTALSNLHVPLMFLN